MTGICGSGFSIVKIIRLPGIRIEYLIVRMIGLLGLELLEYVDQDIQW
jgi:hypothetical protein